MQVASRLEVASLAPPSRATSRASSYHTVLDEFIDARTDQPAESPTYAEPPRSAPLNAASSPSTEPKVEYETSKHSRQGKALIIEHPTLVNFVPTSEIQTAVSQTADRLIIDTILPPTAVLRASDQNSRPHAYVRSPNGTGGAGYDAKEVLRRHEDELRRTLQSKMTSNYDPTGRIKEDIMKTLSGVTRFPDPVGIKGKEYSKGKCPCVCCEMGCENPVQPYKEGEMVAPRISTNVEQPQLGTAHITQQGISQPTIAPVAPHQTVPQKLTESQPSTATSTSTLGPQQPALGPASEPTSSSEPMHSFLDMKEASTRRSGHRRFGSWRGPRDSADGTSSKNRSLFAFLTFGRHNRSRSQLDLPSRSELTQQDFATKQEPLSAPALAPAPALATSSRDPSATHPAEPTRSRSFSDLVKRRRSKHIASISEPIPPLSTSITSPTLFDTTPEYNEPLPSRYSSSERPSFLNTFPTTTPSLPVRHSMDSTRPFFTTPATPPRRSSKLYAVISRPKPGGGARTASDNQSVRRSIDSAIPRNSTGTFLIGQIVEEDELAGMVGAGRREWDGGEASRRQSALMSSYRPAAGSEVGQDQAHAVANGMTERGNSDVVSPDGIEQPHFQIGVAL
ncbi:DNA mismatch repair protein mutS [Pseudozyma hubeiensis SY62]|uniref:DNA mismatch repair protein mutS n=1 Tax=Pseudozyma hubeiensis (strain SY62) TaxID=1305764 RepID=R9PBK4_PSEHS|nr:DNA mismatch repair protein mutS [Pseudozyma hubeiensis SY62]GAC98751.1 DNA mismatch repair protein mutS [Pseudozyma hubeiensis SY62]